MYMGFKLIRISSRTNASIATRYQRRIRRRRHPLSRSLRRYNYPRHFQMSRLIVRWPFVRILSDRFERCVSILATSVQQSLGMLLNPIFSPLVQSQSSSEQTLLSSSKRRHTENSNESSKSQFPPSLLTVASDVANAFASQLSSVTNNAANTSTASSTKSQISTCHLCGKKFQSHDYLQLHLMNKHQLTGEMPNYESQQPRAKSSTSSSSVNGSVINSNAVKKIKLETSESPTTIAMKVSSPMDAISSSNPSAAMPGIVDTYFAAKMADRVSCDICHKVRLPRSKLRLFTTGFVSLF